MHRVPLFLIAVAVLGQAPPGLRLPDSVAPVRYSVDLRVSPAEAQFSGEVEIAVSLREPTKTIWMHAAELTVGEVRVQAGGQDMPARVVSGGKDLLGIALGRAAGPGAATVHIAYTGKVSKSSSLGLFVNEDGGGRYVFSQFEPIAARNAFPCFDEPRFKTPWQITLRVPKGNRAFANTPQVSETTEADGTVAVKFAESKPLPSYLVAIAVGPFETVEGRAAGAKQVPVRILAPRGRAGEAAFAAKVTPEIVERLERYFGTPYPYEKLDSAAVPLVYGFGAMENAGLVTYAQNLILAKPGQQSVGFEREYISVAMHELAHQWFGDLVTTAWWDDIWLNEAFATWIEQRLVAEWKPEWRYEVANVGAMQGAMADDALVSARRIRQPIVSEDDIANAFDSITYMKGAAVIHMFEQWAGAPEFRKGVQLYLKRHAWENATAADFLHDVSEGAGKDMTAAFSTFLDQPGVPVVSVALRCGQGGPALALSQQRFLPLGSPGAPPATWKIPVCVRYGGSGEAARQCTLMVTPTVEMQLAGAGCPAWVEANAEESGYYHVNYQGGLSGRLLEDGGKRLSLPELSGVLGDARSLTRGGELAASEALDMARQTAGNGERLIVTRSIDIVTGVQLYVPGDLRANYARFIRQTYGPRARELGWAARSGESDDVRLLRPRIVGTVAREGEDQEVAAEARKLAERWLGDRSAVAPDVVDAVLGAAAQFGDAALFDRIYAAAKAEKNARDRERLLLALGQFRDPVLARRALGLTLSTEFDARETMRLLYGPLDYPELNGLPFEFVKEHYDELVARLPRGIGADAGSELPTVAGAFCSLERRDEVAAFFKDRVAKSVGGPRELAQVLEEIQVCSAVKDKQQSSVAEFFRRQ